MGKPASSATVGGRVDVPLLVLNLFLVCLSTATIFFSDGYFRRRTQEAALGDNRFLTTEWRILRELKDRTDRILQEKDREIDELRLRYQTLKRQKASTNLLEALESELRRAEAEREAILAARFSPAAPRAVDTLASPAPAASERRREDGTVAELLRDRIRKLEEEAAASRKDAEVRSEEMERLRRDLADARAFREDWEGSFFPGEGSEGGGPDSASAEAVMADTVLELLEKGKESLSGMEPALSLADIRTRSLLRAIVRTPAIREEYPELVDSLDRYFELYGTVERIRGKREAYEEALASMKALLDR